MTTAFQTDAFQSDAFQIVAMAGEVSPYPDPSQVLAGVQYGPGGVYTGTLVIGAGDSYVELRSFACRH